MLPGRHFFQLAVGALRARWAPSTQPFRAASMRWRRLGPRLFDRFARG